ncbi:hypothetical protein ACFL35_05680 [Candidatus Riflebacteria bacterium]
MLKRTCLILLFLLAGSTIFAASCPNCGGIYDDRAPSDGGREHLSRIRAAHETICPAQKNKQSPIYIDDLSINIAQTHWAVIKTIPTLTEVQKLSRSLSGLSKSLYMSLSPADRMTLKRTINSIIRKTRMAVAQNNRLLYKINSLKGEIGQLQQKIIAANYSSHRFIREINRARLTQAELLSKLNTLNGELRFSTRGIKILEQTAKKWQLARAKSRQAFFKTIGDFFRNKNLGKPRDFMTPVVAPQAYTNRRVVHTREIPDISTPLKYNIAPLRAINPITAVTINRYSAFKNIETGISSSKFNSEKSTSNINDVNNRLKKWKYQYQLLKKKENLNSRLLIKTARAREQLKNSIAAVQRKEAEKNFMSDRVEALGNKIDLKLWDLKIRTKKSLGLVNTISEDCIHEERWTVLKKVWSISVQNERAANTGYSMLKLAYDLLDGRLTKLPAVLINPNAPEYRQLANSLGKTAQTLGSEFIENLFDFKLEPLKGKSWVRNIIKNFSGNSQKDRSAR